MHTSVCHQPLECPYAASQTSVELHRTAIDQPEGAGSKRDLVIRAGCLWVHRRVLSGRLQWRADSHPVGAELLAQQRQCHSVVQVLKRLLSARLFQVDVTVASSSRAPVEGAARPCAALWSCTCALRCELYSSVGEGVAMLQVSW